MKSVASRHPSPHASPSVTTSDVLIAGGGIIGLSLALKLRLQGASVTVLEKSTAFGGASSAAAGMLAAEDPHNPPALLSLSRYSLSLYSAFLAEIENLSGEAVPFQTAAAVQYNGTTSYTLAEHSLSPRQLGHSLLNAVRAAGVEVIENTSIQTLRVTSSAVEGMTTSGSRHTAEQFVHATGAWSSPNLGGGPVTPRKGQMLRVRLAAETPLRVVHRAEHVYVVPRTNGPEAGTAVVGATVEDAGFDLSTRPAQLEQLRTSAAALSHETAFVADAPLLESWSGLRPHTPDLLPVIGPLREREWMATGHFRNGILLAPGTAAVLGSLLAQEQPAIDLSSFIPARFPCLR